MRSPMDFIYTDGDGQPRNYREPDIPEDAGFIEELKIELEATADAYRRTQRRVAVGIIAVGTTVSSIINPPEETLDFIKNLTVPVVVQGLNYYSFHKGLKLLRSNFDAIVGRFRLDS